MARMSTAGASATGDATPAALASAAASAGTKRAR